MEFMRMVYVKMKKSNCPFLVKACFLSSMSYSLLRLLKLRTISYKSICLNLEWQRVSCDLCSNFDCVTNKGEHFIYWSRSLCKIPKIVFGGQKSSLYESQTENCREDDKSIPTLTWRQWRHVFLSSAVPMIGFGLIDQIIMIRAGDLIDNTIGVTFGLATLSAAAVGQLCSDTSGVLFGNAIDSIAQNCGMPTPDITEGQRALLSFRIATTFGAAFGVAFGCIIGMSQLAFMDLNKPERMKRQKELDTIFEMVMSDGPKLFHCERATLFVYDKSNGEIWSKAVFGLEKAIRIHRNKSKSLTTWVLDNKEILNCKDAYKDERFNPTYDERYNFVTKSVLAAPVVDTNGEVMAIIMFINKHEDDGGFFTEDDERMVEMMCKHVQIFMEKFDYGAAGDQRMISLREDDSYCCYGTCKRKAVKKFKSTVEDESVPVIHKHGEFPSCNENNCNGVRAPGYQHNVEFEKSFGRYTSELLSTSGQFKTDPTYYNAKREQMKLARGPKYKMDNGNTSMANAELYTPFGLSVGSKLAILNGMTQPEFSEEEGERCCTLSNLSSSDEYLSISRLSSFMNAKFTMMKFTGILNRISGSNRYDSNVMCNVAAGSSNSNCYLSKANCSTYCVCSKTKNIGTDCCDDRFSSEKENSNEDDREEKQVPSDAGDFLISTGNLSRSSVRCSRAVKSKVSNRHPPYWNSHYPHLYDYHHPLTGKIVEINRSEEF